MSLALEMTFTKSTRVHPVGVCLDTGCFGRFRCLLQILVTHAPPSASTAPEQRQQTAGWGWGWGAAPREAGEPVRRAPFTRPGSRGNSLPPPHPPHHSFLPGPWHMLVVAGGGALPGCPGLGSLGWGRDRGGRRAPCLGLAAARVPDDEHRVPHLQQLLQLHHLQHEAVLGLQLELQDALLDDLRCGGGGAQDRHWAEFRVGEPLPSGRCRRGGLTLRGGCMCALHH